MSRKNSTFASCINVYYTMMNKTKYFLMFFVAALLHGCVTDKYDLNKDVVAELCFAPGGFSLGGTNSADVPLSQVIELNDSGELVVDEQGNYMFYKRCDSLKSTEINVGQGSICNGVSVIDTENMKDVSTVTPMKRNPALGNMSFNLAMDLNYKPDVMDRSLADLYYVNTPMMQIMIVSTFENVASFCDNITLKYEIPSFYDLVDESELTETISKNELYSVHRHYINIKGVNFKHTSSLPYEEIGFNKKTGAIVMRGRIGVTGSGIVNIANYEAAVNPIFSIQVMVGSLGVSDVVGCFDKSETISIDPIELDNLPEFLTNDEVVIDVENPIVRLTVDNEVPTDITLTATFAGYKDGEKISELKVGKQYGTPDITVYGPEGNDTIRRTNVWISRKPVELPDTVDDNVVIPEISNIIRKLPQYIEVEGIAKTDPSRVVSMSLTKTYHATPSYELAIPLRMGREMKIVYEETIDDIHDKLEKVSVESVVVTCEAVNNIPLNLHVVAEAVDANGNPVKDVDIYCGDVIPAHESKNITLTLDCNGNEKAIQNVYQINIKAYAESSAALEGQLLNMNQNLRLNDLRMVLKNAKYKF